MRFILSSLILLSILSCGKESPVVTDPVISYTLTVSSGTGGSVSSNGGSYNQGQSVSIIATPNPEYVFVNWSNGSTDNPLSITVNSNQTVTANFEKRKYPLTVSITGSGTVSEEIISSGKSTTEYNSGSVIRLTANPSDEWMFTGWSGSVSSTENPIELTVNESKNVTVTFQQTIFNRLIYNNVGIINLTDHSEVQSSDALSGGGSGSFNFISGGIEHYVIPGTLFFGYPLTPVVHFVKRNQEWEFLKSYDEVRMGAGRDVKILNGNMDLVFADHGPELTSGDWPGGDMWIARNITQSGIEWTKINETKKFFHSLSLGDFNNDGYNDITSVTLESEINLWVSNGDSYQSEEIILIGNQNDEIGFSGIKLYDLNMDGTLEIIGGSDIQGGGIIVYSKRDQSYTFDPIFTSGQIGSFSGEYGKQAVTSIEVSDIDLDGDFDLIVATEIALPPFGEVFQIWTQEENFNFIPGQIFDFRDTPASREFDLFDIDSDGDEDIVFNAHGFYFLDEDNLPSHSFVQNLSRDNGGSGIFNFDNLIYYNEDGVFSNRNNGNSVQVESIFGHSYIKPYFHNNNLKFMGYFISNDYGPGGVPLPSESYLVEYFIE
jgi:hypothetical protein